MKRGSSIGAPHVVQIAMGCDGQPILPKAPRRNAKPGLETLAISKRATVRWWLSRSMSRFRPKAKARELLASLPLPRPQDTRRSAIATRSRAGLRTAREQHDLPVGEFQRIVMDHSVLHVDLPEAAAAGAELKPTARSTILAAVMAEIRRVPMPALRLHDRAMHEIGRAHV